MTAADASTATATTESSAPAIPASNVAARLSGPSLAIVVDTSRTNRARGEALKKTVDRFVRRLPEGEVACVYSASDKPVLVQELTDNKHDVEKAIDRMRIRGRSALLPTVQQAAEHLRSSTANEHPALVVFTAAQEVNEPNLEDAIAALTNGTPVQFNAVAGPGSRWQLQEQLQRLAVKTGGFAFFPPGGGDLNRVADAAASKFRDGDAAIAQASNGRRAYQTIVVRAVPVADNPDTAEFQSGDDELLQKMLIGRLMHDKIFANVLDGARQATAAPGGKALELVASIVEYRRGNRMQRQLIGYMGGAKVKVNVMVRDLASGRPVQAFITQGASSSGLFGGSNEEVQTKALKEVVQNIVSEIKKYRQEK